MTTYAPPRLTYQDDAATLYLGDCIDVMGADVNGYPGALGYAARLIPDSSIDSIVTDPPYGLGFMGRAWDALPPGLPWAVECLRVLKPGGHLLAFGGTRTWHRLAVAVEDAGFELRDSIAWLYGSGFPKSRNVTDDMGAYLAGDPLPAREIDPRVYRVTAAIRDARDARGLSNRDLDGLFGTNGMSGHWTSKTSQPMVPSVRQWEILREILHVDDPALDALVAVLGSQERTDEWGNTPEGEFLGALRNDPQAAGARGWGTALKPGFEPCVVGRKPLAAPTVALNVRTWGTGAINIEGCRIGSAGGARLEPGAGGFDAGTVNALGGHLNSARSPKVDGLGRWPSNVIVDTDTAQELDAQSGVLTSGANLTSRGADGARAAYGTFAGQSAIDPARGAESGGASRFFYVAKAGSAERPKVDGEGHPTVKPLALMRWLIRLVTPPGGVVLEPFLGSGTTVEAGIIEGFHVIGIERDPTYMELVRARIGKPIQPDLFGGLA